MRDCEFKNRCLNSSNCFRCYNLNLLKLPEDKFKKRNNQKKIFDNRKAQAENSWEGLEEDMVRELNNVPSIVSS